MATMVNEQTGAPVHMDVEDGIAIIRLDQPGKPVNVISAALVTAMDDILRRLEEAEADGSVRAAVILSEKKGTWIAGADIEQFKDFRTPADAEAASRAGQQLLNRLEQLRVPVVAAIDGAALGGGLEMALACTYRIASDSPKTKLGLPEVNLGIVPGAGGTQRLPRLIGLRAALDLMLTGKQLDGRRARSAGIVDEVVPAAILPVVARQVANDLAEGNKEPRGAARRRSPQWVENLPGMRQLIFGKARQGVMSKTQGAVPRAAPPAGRGGEGAGPRAGRGAGAGGEGVRRAGGDARGALAGSPLLRHHGGQERSRAGPGGEARQAWSASPWWARASWAPASPPRRPRAGSRCGSRT